MICGAFHLVWIDGQQTADTVIHHGAVPAAVVRGWSITNCAPWHGHPPALRQCRTVRKRDWPGKRALTESASKRPDSVAVRVTSLVRLARQTAAVRASHQPIRPWRLLTRQRKKACPPHKSTGKLVDIGVGGALKPIPWGSSPAVQFNWNLSCVLRQCRHWTTMSPCRRSTQDRFLNVRPKALDIFPIRRWTS
jgi:hypothetical protein